MKLNGFWEIKNLGFFPNIYNHCGSRETGYDQNEKNLTYLYIRKIQYYRSVEYRPGVRTFAGELTSSLVKITPSDIFPVSLSC